MAMEYHYFNTARSFAALKSWNSHTISTVTRRVIFISGEPLPLGFIKVNFNYSIHDTSDGVGYVIQDVDSRLLMIEGSFLFKS